MDTLGTIVSNLTGNVERAIIEILDERTADQNKVREENKLAGKKKLSSFGMTTTNIASLSGNAMKKAASLTPSDIMEYANQQINTPSGYKRFSVQFNPATLQLAAQGGGTAQIIDITSAAKEVSVGNMTTRIQLTVPLIFDKVYIKDAFMADKFALNPTSIIAGAAANVAQVVTKQDYSVQPIVEGFIAALRNPKTRKVTFAWSKMCYSGFLNSINSRYTMFSVTGKPIRAEVNLSILCTDQDACKGYMGQWQKHYEDAFVNEITSDYERGVQKVSNLVNLPF